MQWYRRLVSEMRLGAGDRTAYELQVLARIMEHAACYDQLNLFNLGCVEVMVRKLQMAEEKYKERLYHNQGLGDNVGEDHHLFMGTQGTRGNLCVAPALQKFIAEELQKESAVLKERRKAREERSLARGKAKAKAEPG